MGVYRADGEQEIKALFLQEGDALARAGFTEPDLSLAPEDYRPESGPVNALGAVILTDEVQS